MCLPPVQMGGANDIALAVLAEQLLHQLILAER